jgi:hypothetical protein
MSIEQVQNKQSRIILGFNLIVSVLILGVGGFLVYAAHFRWFGARGPRISLIAWLVVVYGVVRFILYLRRHRAS